MESMRVLGLIMEYAMTVKRRAEDPDVHVLSKISYLHTSMWTFRLIKFPTDTDVYLFQSSAIFRLSGVATLQFILLHKNLVVLQLTAQIYITIITLQSALFEHQNHSFLLVYKAIMRSSRVVVDSVCFFVLHCWLFLFSTVCGFVVLKTDEGCG